MMTRLTCLVLYFFFHYVVQLLEFRGESDTRETGGTALGKKTPEKLALLEVSDTPLMLLSAGCCSYARAVLKTGILMGRCLCALLQLTLKVAFRLNIYVYILLAKPNFRHNPIGLYRPIGGI